MEIISAVLKKMNHTPTTECLKGLFLAVYEGFVEELDAIDNGIPMYADGHPKYRINTHLSARVHRLNPEWNTKNPEPADELFKKAMDLVGNEFTEKVVEVNSTKTTRLNMPGCCLYATLYIHLSICF